MCFTHLNPLYLQYMDLKKFSAKAAQKKEALTDFLNKLDTLVPEDMDALVAREDAKVWEKVDCMSCANCCKTMTPMYKKSDIKRIAAHLKLKPKDFIAKYLTKEEGSELYMNATLPCTFLVDNKCSIYEVRPDDCAEFPHHNKTPFDLYNDTYKNNLVYCPATLMLVDRLKNKIEKEYEW